MCDQEWKEKDNTSFKNFEAYEGGRGKKVKQL